MDEAGQRGGDRDPWNPGARVALGLGSWCAGLTVFAAAVWVRTYANQCTHDQIYHQADTWRDCHATLASGGVLRTTSAFWELLLLLGVVAVPLVVLGPVVLRGLRGPR